MNKIFFGHTAEVAAWVGERIGRKDWFAPMAFGVTKDDELVGGVVYDNYRGHDVEMSCAGKPGWLDRWLIRAFFEYPFGHLGCQRVTAIVREDNVHALAFDRRLGFCPQGFIPDWLEPGVGGIVHGMSKANCRWISNG